MKEKIKKIILISTLIIVGVFFTHKTLAQQAPGFTFTASPAFISAGQSSTLSWKYTMSPGSDTLIPGSTCVKTEGGAGWTNLGSEYVNSTFGTGPLTQTTTYTMTCSGIDYAPITKSVTVTIGTAPAGGNVTAPTRGTEILTLTSNKTSIDYGTSATLTWKYATTTNDLVIGLCDQGGVNVWSGKNQPTSGTFNTGPLTETKTYSMHCWRTQGIGFSWDERSVTITVKPPERGSSQKNISGITVMTDGVNEADTTATTAVLRGRMGLDRRYPDGCTSATGYSITNGQLCNQGDLNSTIDATAYFRYSSSPISPVFCNDIYGSNMTSTKDIPLGKLSSASFFQPISGLTPDTDYYYCAVVSNKKHIIYENENPVKTFHTNCYQTTASTKEATSVGSNSATLNGIYCSTKDVTTSFVYRKTKEDSTTGQQELPWKKVGEKIHSIGTKSNLSGSFNFKISGLESNKKYEFKAVVKTDTENTETSILKFTTNPPKIGTSNTSGGGFDFLNFGFNNLINGGGFSSSGTGTGGFGSGTGTGTSISGTGTGNTGTGGTGTVNTGTGNTGTGTGGTGTGGTGGSQDFSNINITNSNLSNTAITSGSFSNGTFSNASFSGGSFSNMNFTGGNMTNSSITSGNITNGTINSGKITSGNVNSGTVSSGTLSSGNINSGNVNSGTLSTGNITSGNVNSGNITAGKLTSGTIEAGTITGGTLDGVTINTSGGNITNATISGANITGVTIDNDGNITSGTISSGTISSGTITNGTITSGTISNGTINNGIITSGTISGGTNNGQTPSINNGTWGGVVDGAGGTANSTSGTWGTGTGSGTWTAVSGVGGGGVAVWEGTGNGTGTWSSATGSGTWTNNTGTGGSGTGTWGNLVLGQKAVPPNDAIVRYHEGIETVFTRQIINNPIYQKTYGYKTGDDLLTFAWNLSDQFARMFGYVNGSGREIRVSYPDIAAYQLQLEGNKLTVYEYYAEKIVDIRNLTTVFKNASGYEYYFKKN